MTVPSSRRGSFFKSRTGLALVGFLGVAAFLLALEHRAHIPGDYWLLVGLLALCILMHLLMHGGHGSHGNASHHDKE